MDAARVQRLTRATNRVGRARAPPGRAAKPNEKRYSETINYGFTTVHANCEYRVAACGVA
eukprot:271200-Prymnesium_polylepis.1